MIVESRPLSREKRWVVEKIVKKDQTEAIEEAVEAELAEGDKE